MRDDEALRSERELRTVEDLIYAQVRREDEERHAGEVDRRIPKLRYPAKVGWKRAPFYQFTRAFLP